MSKTPSHGKRAFGRLPLLVAAITLLSVLSVGCIVPPHHGHGRGHHYDRDDRHHDRDRHRDQRRHDRHDRHDRKDRHDRHDRGHRGR